MFLMWKFVFGVFDRNNFLIDLKKGFIYYNYNFNAKTLKSSKYMDLAGNDLFSF